MNIFIFFMNEDAHRSGMSPSLKLVYSFDEMGSEVGVQSWDLWMGSQMNWVPQEMPGLLLISELI